MVASALASLHMQPSATTNMYYKWSGKRVKCEGLTIQLTSVLSERDVENLGECVVVADGKLEGISSPVVVKLRVQYGLTKSYSYSLIFTD
jgi:hypothetical protein